MVTVSLPLGSASHRGPREVESGRRDCRSDGSVPVRKVDIARIADRVRRCLRAAHNQGPGSWNSPPKILPAVVSRRKGGTDGQSSTPNFDRIVASRPAQRRPATFLVGRPIPDRNVRGMTRSSPF